MFMWSWSGHVIVWPLGKRSRIESTRRLDTWSRAICISYWKRALSLVILAMAFSLALSMMSWTTPFTSSGLGAPTPGPRIAWGRAWTVPAGMSSGCQGFGGQISGVPGMLPSGVAGRLPGGQEIELESTGVPGMLPSGVAGTLPGVAGGGPAGASLPWLLWHSNWMILAMSSPRPRKHPIRLEAKELAVGLARAGGAGTLEQRGVSQTGYG